LWWTQAATLTIVDNDGGSSGGDEYYQYDALGNLLQKGATAYTYGASAGGCVAGTPASKPHAAVTAGAASYAYDADGERITRTTGDGRAASRPPAIDGSSMMTAPAHDSVMPRLTNLERLIRHTRAIRA
jgi:hypothetical protein